MHIPYSQTLLIYGIMLCSYSPASILFLPHSFFMGFPMHSNMIRNRSFTWCVEISGVMHVLLRRISATFPYLEDHVFWTAPKRARSSKSSKSFALNSSTPWKKRPVHHQCWNPWVRLRVTTKAYPPTPNQENSFSSLVIGSSWSRRFQRQKEDFFSGCCQNIRIISILRPCPWLCALLGYIVLKLRKEVGSTFCWWCFSRTQQCPSFRFSGAPHYPILVGDVLCVGCQPRKSVFDPSCEIHAHYDLKGSLYHRKKKDWLLCPWPTNLSAVVKLKVFQLLCSILTNGINGKPVRRANPVGRMKIGSKQNFWCKFQSNDDVRCWRPPFRPMKCWVPQRLFTWVL